MEIDAPIKAVYFSPVYWFEKLSGSLGTAERLSLYDHDFIIGLYYDGTLASFKVLATCEIKSPDGSTRKVDSPNIRSLRQKIRSVYPLGS